ncbi:MAG: hypothetical protein MK207_06600 [Saprospiraceae bacterium]|nr:hypothetical protein [Saprospiraceae bacterium]
MKYLFLVCISVFCLTMIPYTSNSNSVTPSTSISTIDNAPPPVDRNPRKKVKQKKKRKKLNRKNKKNAFWKFFNKDGNTSSKKGAVFMGLAAMFLALTGGLIGATVAIVKNMPYPFLAFLTIFLAAACLVWCIIFLVKSLVYYSKITKGHTEKSGLKYKASKEGKLLKGIILTILGALLLGPSIAYLFSVLSTWVFPTTGIVLGIAFILGALVLLFLGIWSLIRAKKAPSIKD